METAQELVREAINILQKRHGATKQDIERALHGPAIPATAFTKPLTPLETATLYLDQQGKSVKQIAALLHRPQSTIRNALENAKRKNGSAPEDPDTPYRIPATAFANPQLSPAEAVIHHLATHYELTNAHIARLLDRDPRNTHKQLQNAKEKLGGEAR